VTRITHSDMGKHDIFPAGGSTNLDDEEVNTLETKVVELFSCRYFLLGRMLMTLVESFLIQNYCFC